MKGRERPVRFCSHVFEALTQGRIKSFILKSDRKAFKGYWAFKLSKRTLSDGDYVKRDKNGSKETI